MVEGLSKALEMSLGERRFKVTPPEHLAARWLQAGRPKDIGKIQAFDEALVMDVKILNEVLDRFGLIGPWREIQGGLSDAYRY